MSTLNIVVVTCSFLGCLSISTSGLTMWHACESNGPTQLVKSLSFLAALLKDLICSIENCMCVSCDILRFNFKLQGPLEPYISVSG